MLSAHHTVPITRAGACGLVLCSRTELLTRTVFIVFVCGYPKPTLWILNQWFLGNVYIFSCMMHCRSGLVRIPVLMDTDGSSGQAPHPGAEDIHTLDNPSSLDSSCYSQQLHTFFRFQADHVSSE